jgi:hypothetical protein
MTSPRTPLTEADIAALVGGLPPAHALTIAPASYREGFVRAFAAVHGLRPNARQLLDQKFFVPNTTSYSFNQFLQSAAELSVAHHVVKSQATAFESEKKMNPGVNDRDVDVYFEVGATRVPLEVKCPEEQHVAPGTLTLDFAGRHPDPKGIFGEIQGVFAQAANLPPELRQLTLAQHKDNKLKDYLISAHDKFSPSPDLDQLNVLFVACGEELQPWYHYLHEREGLFTPQSFHPVQTFERTQVVILSNLKYFHTQAAAHHDWTLKDVFLLPVLNPTAATRVMTETLEKGLSIFDHHLRPYNAYRLQNGGSDVPMDVIEATRLNTYIHGWLSDPEFQRFFPSTERRRAKLKGGSNPRS